MASGRSAIRDWTQNVLARAVLGSALLLPYALRVRLVGWIVAHVVAPFAGWRRRIRENLDHVMPELSRSDRQRLIIEVANNVGRTLIEIYSGKDFVARARESTVGGPGAGALEQARKAGRPVVLATAHLGNYDAVRGKLSREGYPMAALYRPMKNAAFHKHYLKAISTIAEPVFPTDGRGVMSLVRHLKSGGIIGIVADVASTRAPLLSFFGKPAHTPLSAAEWALKYDALLIPIFGIRQPDGLSFRIHVCDPVPHSTPAEMMQAYNDQVERIVRAHPEQWFWIHKRWKLGRKARKKLSEAARPQEQGPLPPPGP